MRRRPVQTVIEGIGLTLGITSCLLIALYVQHELSFDRFHEKADRIYQVLMVEEDATGTRSVQASTSAPLGPALVANYPEVETAVRLATHEARILHDNVPYAQDVWFADATFFDVFTFPLRHGNSATALVEPEGVVISEDYAIKHFGHPAPLGEQFIIELNEQSISLRITGVARSTPTTTTIRFDVLLPYSVLQYTLHPSMREMAFSRWDFPAGNTFLLLAPEASTAALEAKFPPLIQQHLFEDVRLSLQPLTAVHMNPNVRGVLTPTGNPLHCFILVTIALLILLMASINFMMLALASSQERAREVGIRKVLGADPQQIWGQFWGEAFLVSSAAAVMATGLAALVLPHFNRLVGKELDLSLLGTVPILTGLGVSLLLVSLVASSYPCVVLTRWNPSTILKGKIPSVRAPWLIYALVVKQYIIAIALGIAALVLARQVDYLLEKPLGFDKDAVLLLHTNDVQEGAKIFERFNERAKDYGRISGVTSSWTSPFGHPGWPAELELGDTMSVRVFMNVIGEEFVPTMGMQLADGRDLSATRTADHKNAVLINEAALHTLRWESPYGKTLPVKGSIVGNMEVIGVVKDYHFRSLHHLIEPTILVPRGAMGNGVGIIYVRLTAGPIPPALKTIRQIWKDIAPNAPFDYAFMSDMVAAQYEQEQRWYALVRYATFFALSIACLGLFAMTALLTERRTKEISVRKILGASTWQLIGLLSKDFLGLVMIAFVLASPIAYIAMQYWLQRFAYQIDLDIPIFAAAGVLALTIAFVTVSYHTVQKARANPIDGLRME